MVKKNTYARIAGIHQKVFRYGRSIKHNKILAGSTFSHREKK